MAKRDLAAELLRELGQDRTQYHSGEELSVRLGVSRTAVWKAACRLREQGYAIESVTRLGYRLTALPDGMTKELLEQYLPQGRGETVICYEETDSTNTRGMQLALEGAPTGTVVLADRQTHGNGRLGRSFASPAGQGVYLSYLLRPDFDPAALSLLTSCAGLAVCQVLEQHGLAPAIKWPNDIILDRRKVCGILTKLTSDAESGASNGAVIGIGVNVTQQPQDFPEELRDKAVSVREAGAAVPRAAIAAGIITRLDDLFLRQHILSQPAENLIGELTRRSCTIGRRVEVISPTGQYEARAVAIAPDAGLIVELPDGSRRTVSSGEVSVRGLLGYT